jgi:drug/metabolite transporter (DMT)-like permease
MAASNQQHVRPAIGIACMLTAGVLMTLNNAILKWVTAGYPVGQIIFTRGVFIWLPIAFLIWRSGGVRTLRIQRFDLHGVRAACLILSAFMYVTALRYLPLADVTAISFSTPLFVTALAPLLLRETVGWRRWSAVVVGFLGIVTIARPTENVVALAVLLPLGSAFGAAMRDIVTRRMTETESSNAILCTTTAAAMLAGLATLPLGWTAPSAMDLGLMACSGILSGFGHHFMIEAFRNAEAVMVSPFRYITMIWAVLLGYVVWGDLPDEWVILGVVLVVLSGIYIFHREIFLRTRARSKTPE